MGDDLERISIVISTKGRIAELRRCIISILKQTSIPYELVIVDAGEIPIPEVFFKPFREALDIRYIHAQVGLTDARNMGVLESKGELILFLDDDTELEPDYIEKLIDVFLSDYHHQIGGVSGKIIEQYNEPNPSLIGKIRRTGRKIIGRLFFLPVEKDGCFQPAGFPTSPPFDTRDIMQVQCLYGANMAFRREVLKKYKFDEALEGYCFMEDDDIAYRISREYINIYTPHARLRHFESPVSRDRDFARKKMLVKNYHYLFRKNFPHSFSRTMVFWWSILGLIITDIIVINPEGVMGLLAGIHEIRYTPFHKGSRQ
jgi:GT2 family glycosyltransferase